MRKSGHVIDSTMTPRFPLASEVAFSAYNRKYDGGCCTIVGRGPTEFDYAKLGELNEPVFFINDAVCLEKYVRSESFFFAHDAQLLVWLNGAIKSTAVLPIDGKVFRANREMTFQHAGNLVFYHWREKDKEELLYLTRDQLAEVKQLYTHTGTIHSLLHFVWFCGFRQVKFIGCDCITDNNLLDAKFQTADGYDPRLQNLSGSSAGKTYPAIGRAQALLTTLFGFEAIYLGTPAAKK